MSVQLIALNGNKLELCREGIDVLEQSNNKTRTPLLVVAIAGLYRTGKSFLLNKIISTISKSQNNTNTINNTNNATQSNSNNTFSVGQTTEACTRGIWIQDPNITIRGARLIFLDSEGLASLDQDESHDAKIFSLSLLLSSYFMLNTQGVIDEAAIDRLYLVGEITKRVCVASNINPNPNETTTDEQKDLSDYFPPLLWLLRDFHLSLEEKGKKLTENEYLEKSLADRTVTKGRRTEERNDTRRALRQLFRKRKVFTMVRPCLNEKDLRKADELQDDSLRPEFLAELNTLCTIIQTDVQKKNILGTEVDGKQLISIAKKYIIAINNGAVPEIRNTWERVVSETYTNALQVCLSDYTTALQTKLTFEEILKGNKRGVEGYLERSTSYFYETIDNIYIETLNQTVLKFQTLTKGCGTTLIGERCRLETIALMNQKMYSIKRNFILQLENKSKLLAISNLEKTIIQCKKNDLITSNNLDTTLDLFEKSIQQFHQISIDVESTKSNDTVASFTPSASDVMASAWPQRLLPMLASLCSRHTTKFRIDTASKERKIENLMDKCNQISDILSTVKQELEQKNNLLSASETKAAGLVVQLEYSEIDANEMRTMMEKEINKRIECGQELETEKTLRIQTEHKLKEESNEHLITKSNFYNQWLEREAMIDTMEIERVMDVLLEKVERNSQVNQLKELLLRSSEERKEVGIELQKMMTRVSILPSRYQKRIFLRDDIPEDMDFYELMDAQRGIDDEEDEVSLADGCQTQVS